ncbi:MAG: hypothetical protein BWY77_00973 [bacterium ADurb.Bin431]|nr:MAG: hypothetical protein BWY77_00973 [bacterium ADurb.Bin431]
MAAVVIEQGVEGGLACGAAGELDAGDVAGAAGIDDHSLKEQTPGKTAAKGVGEEELRDLRCALITRAAHQDQRLPNRASCTAGLKTQLVLPETGEGWLPEDLLRKDVVKGHNIPVAGMTRSPVVVEIETLFRRAGSTRHRLQQDRIHLTRSTDLDPVEPHWPEHLGQHGLAQHHLFRCRRSGQFALAAARQDEQGEREQDQSTHDNPCRLKKNPNDRSDDGTHASPGYIRTSLKRRLYHSSKRLYASSHRKYL